MQLKIRARVALITAGIVLAVPAAGFAAPHKLPLEYQAWSQVAGCESHGWQVLGYAYPDSLGIDRPNYVALGGRPQAPGPVSRANRLLQIRVAERLRARYHLAIPDQHGCGAW